MFRPFPYDVLQQIQEVEAWFAHDEHAETEVRVRIHFYDSANRSWKRDWDGELSLKTPDGNHAPS